jgi:hypothetical protein
MDSYKGWLLYWTKWKVIPNQSFYVGQWLARRPDISWGLYSSYPGACSRYSAGDVFDTDLRQNQFLPEYYATDYLLDWAKDKPKKSLFDLIDKEEES